MENENVKKRAREDMDDSSSSSSERDSPEVKRLKEDLLDSFEEDDELCTTSEDLDSFMRRFEEEISRPPTTATVIDLTSEGGESKPDLGYLLGASDDELGLPPSRSEAENEEDGTELIRVSSDSSGLSDLWGFDEQTPSFDSLEFGFSGVDNLGAGAGAGAGAGEYVALDGLFDYSDMGFGPADFSWRPETLPAQ